MTFRFNALALALGVALCMGAGTISAGIPTVDAPTLGQLVVNAQEAATQAKTALDTAKDGIEQVRTQFEAHKSMITGNSNLGDFLNNPALNKMLPLADWSEVYDSVRDLSQLRERYGLNSDDPSIQKKFDKYLAIADALERTYDASSERVKNATELRGKLNQVETPQQKEDLQLRYQHEMLELQVQQMRVDQMNMLVAQQEKIDNRRRIQDFKDYVNGRRPDMPKN